METLLSNPAQAGAAFMRGGISAVFPGRAPLASLSVPEAAALAPMPYHDPVFSERMLRLHLDTTTDEASRRPELVAAHLDLLAPFLLSSARLEVLHPACGPGLIAEAMVRAGWEVKRYVGVDIGPATVRHARDHAPPGFDYRHGDARDLEQLVPERDFGLAMLTYETLNLFAHADLRELLARVGDMLVDGGIFVAECRGPLAGTIDQRRVHRYPKGSLFADGPHVILDEWATIGSPPTVVVRRMTVLGSSRERPEVYHSVIWSYSIGELSGMFEEAGFDIVDVLAVPEAASDVPDAVGNVFVVGRRRNRPA
ncbi:class I SAM-dependent methyltransferase [Nonomuraea angiospora]|uniref:SAM-dependent methyltransferase n=1 Tax=Nonomuraea angiospora TaxID=46172 RepID=A0ABR9LNT4_9ACTN|nr:class I SAM-dependent methyltransferase [Nonomuraea angiospora]MBE1582303.1 SAM-dependent methyltransferase [Nonomuraea angiospora]